MTNIDASPNGYVARATLPRVEVQFMPAGSPAFAALVALHGEHDLYTCDALDEALASIAGAVLLDLSDCPFIDSSVIGVIVERARLMRREGHRLELVVPRANAHVARVVDVVGLRTYVAVHERVPVDPRAR